MQQRLYIFSQLRSGGIDRLFCADSHRHQIGDALRPPQHEAQRREVFRRTIRSGPRVERDTLLSSSLLTRFASSVNGAVIALINRLTNASAITPLRSKSGLSTSRVTGTFISMVPLASVRIAGAGSSGRSTALSLAFFTRLQFVRADRVGIPSCMGELGARRVGHDPFV
jgi:hypothetical protein